MLEEPPVGGLAAQLQHWNQKPPDFLDAGFSHWTMVPLINKTA